MIDLNTSLSFICLPYKDCHLISYVHFDQSSTINFVLVFMVKCHFNMHYLILHDTVDLNVSVFSFTYTG